MTTSGFRDADSAQRAMARLATIAGFDLDSFFEIALEGHPDPDQAINNLERWLIATASPALFLQELAASPNLGRQIVYLIGVSQPIADSLIQNPELATLVFDSAAQSEPCRREAVEKEGRRLLAASSSFSHSLDRLRFLRQKWNLLIVLNDLTGTRSQIEVWRALSDLAEALIQLSAEVVAAGRGSDPNDLGVIAFGKLAGGELNYSSDVDLAYIGAADLTKQSTSLTKALADRMGRGTLYRVDLRLRPYGSAGPPVQTFAAVDAYYLRYAEPWEIQALIRSKVVVGSPDLQERWKELRETYCFRPRLSDLALEQMLEMRARIGDHAKGDDLKRGVGGIRDVEFLVQIMQLLHGHGVPEIRDPNTLVALAALDEHALIEHAVASSLTEGYTFLRRLENRLQLVGDQQTHAIPEAPNARNALASLMGYSSWETFSTELDRQRRTIHALYRSVLNLDSDHADPSQEDRGWVRDALGPLADSGMPWLDGIPGADAYFRSLRESPESFERLRKLLTNAPRLVSVFRGSLPLTELFFSGEIEQEYDAVAKMAEMPIDTTLRQVADLYLGAHTVLLAQWALSATAEPDPSIVFPLSELMEEFLRHCRRRLCGQFDMVALGSLGACEISPASDADLLFLVRDPKMQRQAEFEAQQFLGLVAELGRYGAGVSVDLRLRPDGGKGLLVRSYDGFRAYDFEGMAMWERFALGSARLLEGEPEALQVVQHSANGLPLTPERLRELAKMKRRIETERVKPQHQKRNVKLGLGGLSDIDWLVHLHEMRYPTALHAGETVDMEERIRRLGRAGFMNTFEVDSLLNARRNLLDLRVRLYLLGQGEDRVPENPDRLDRLASILGFADGNAFLASHERLIDNVRGLYEEALERLRA